MSGRRVGTAAAVAMAAALVATAAPAAGATVSASPKIHPAFDRSTLDYTVRCKSREPVRFDVRPPHGTRVALDGGKEHTDRFGESARLVPGAAAELRFERGSHVRRYRFRCLPKGFPHWRVRRHGTPQSAYYVLTANHGLQDPGYSVVFDARGVPVWWMRQTPSPFDADLLPDGNLAWTKFVALSPDSERFTEWTLDGRKVRTYATVGTPTNQHDLQLLPNGDALMISYRQREDVDLSRWGGPKHASVLDGEIQEIDPEGHLVWRWNSKDHVALGEVGRWLGDQIRHPRVHARDGHPIYDLVHVNSVEPSGDYVVASARYMDAVFAIDRRSGAIAWKLGGTHTGASLAIDGDPLAEREFGGQHDARLENGGRLVTVYDNGTLREREPRALAYRLDLGHRRARLVRSIGFADAGRSECCGSARRLPGGNWVMAWGGTPWATEQRRDGSVVLSLELRDGYRTYRAIPVLPGRLSRRDLAAGMARSAARHHGG